MPRGDCYTAADVGKICSAERIGHMKIGHPRPPVRRKPAVPNKKAAARLAARQSAYERDHVGTVIRGDGKSVSVIPGEYTMPGSYQCFL